MKSKFKLNTLYTIFYKYYYILMILGVEMVVK